jgi:predicted MFS family arabinose efflux permease
MIGRPAKGDEMQISAAQMSMAHTSTVRSRSIVALLYLFGVVSMALIGILSPLALRITADLHVRPSAIGLTIALFSLPSAATATIGGGIVDRIGPRAALLIAASLIVSADIVLALAPSLLLFDLGMLVMGMGFVGLVIGVPATMMAVLSGPLRTRAMAFWSTYGPTGFSLGLLMAVPFTGLLNWRFAFVAHGLLMLVLGLAAIVLLPQVPRGATISGESARTRIARLFVAVRDPAAVRLAVAIAMPNMISYGTSLVAVTYISRVHGVSLAASATTVAVAKIVAMLLGGTVMGSLLANGVAPRQLFKFVIAGGIVAQAVLYVPASPLPLAVGGLMLWLFAYGGQCGVCMAMMPTLATGDLLGGALAGLINQVISIGSFLTPTIYFALPGWTAFVGIAVVGSLISVLALPVQRTRTTELA